MTLVCLLMVVFLWGRDVDATRVFVAAAVAHRVRSRVSSMGLLEAALGLDAFVGGVDLAGAGLGLLAHGFGQVAQAIGMVFGDQLAIGALHRAIVHVAR